MRPHWRPAGFRWPGPARDVPLLVLAGLALRVAAFVVYAPQRADDSALYLRTASTLSDGYLTGRLGQRTPGYPLLLAILGLTDWLVWIAQAGLGIATSLAVWHTVGLLGASRRLALLAALTVSLTPYVVFTEAFILSDSLASFCTAVAVFFAVRVLVVSRPRYRDAVAAGLLLAAAGVVRPQLLSVAVIVVASVFLIRVAGRVWRVPTDWTRPSVGTVAAMVIPSVVTVLVLAITNFARFDTFAPTTLVGINLMSTVGNVAQSAPPEHREVADIYLDLRAEHYAKYGTHVLTEFETVRALRQSGDSFPEASARLRSLALSLIWREPGRYLENVAASFALSWKPVTVMPVSALRPWARPAGNLHRALVGADLGARAVLLMSAFLASAWAVVTALLGRSRSRRAAVLAVLAGTILAEAVLQSLVTYGDMNRPMMTFFPIMMVVLAGCVAGGGGRGDDRALGVPLEAV